MKQYPAGRVCGMPGCTTILRRTNAGWICDPCANREHKAEVAAIESGSPASAGDEVATKAAPAARAKKGESVAQKDSGYAMRLAKLRAWCTDGTAKRLRLAAGLSLGDISREIGTDKATIMHWENGERRPQAAEFVARYMSLLDRIAAELDNGSEIASQLISEPEKCDMGNSHTPAPAARQEPAPAPLSQPERPASEAAAPSPEMPLGLPPFAGIDFGTAELVAPPLDDELNIMYQLADLDDAARERVLQYAVGRWWLK